ncbi:hypothetical protein RZS08_15320, partial [Arthrospira platensis SPKY1]|nr:hypothetical protein [Arthrospira platensis SPKY1]
RLKIETTGARGIDDGGINRNGLIAAGDRFIAEIQPDPDIRAPTDIVDPVAQRQYLALARTRDDRQPSNDRIGQRIADLRGDRTRRGRLRGRSGGETGGWLDRRRRVGAHDTPGRPIDRPPRPGGAGMTLRPRSRVSGRRRFR